MGAIRYRPVRSSVARLAAPVAGSLISSLLSLVDGDHDDANQTAPP